MDEKRTLQMDLRLYVEDVTEHYNRKPEGMGKIFDAWLFDANLHVHICSLTPSFEVYYIGSTYIPEREMTEEEREEADEYLRDANRETPTVDYMGTGIEKSSHPYRIEPRPEMGLSECPDCGDDLPEDATGEACDNCGHVFGEGDDRTEEIKIMEEHIEYLQGNTGDWESLVGEGA